MLNRLLMGSGETKLTSVDEVFSQKPDHPAQFSMQPNAWYSIDTYTPSQTTAGHDGWYLNTYLGAIHKIVEDASGNTFVCGTVWDDDNDNGGGQPSGFVAKLSASGTTLWKKSWSTAGGAAQQTFDMALDTSGNVYVLLQSTTSGRAEICKYDTNGNKLAQRRIYVPSINASYYYGMAIDASGNIFIAGYVYDSGYGIYLMKITPSFSIAWVKKPQIGESFYGYFRSMAIDGSGDIYITTGWSPSQDAIVKMSGSTGATLFSYHISTSDGGSTSHSVVAAYGSDIYLAYSQISGPLASYVPVFVKLNTSLVPQWTRRLEYKSSDSYDYIYTRGLAADASGVTFAVNASSYERSLFGKISSSGTLSYINATYGMNVQGTPNGNPICVGATNTLIPLTGTAVNPSIGVCIIRVPNDGSCTSGSQLASFSRISAPLGTPTVSLGNIGATSADIASPTITTVDTANVNQPFTFIYSKQDAVTSVGNKACFLFTSVYGAHAVYDTVRGDNKRLLLSSTTNEQTVNFGLTFTGSAINLGENNIGANNAGDASPVCFSTKSKFFDIVTYTGNGAGGRNIPHSLGAVPGCIIIKSRTSSTIDNNWAVWHKADGSTYQTGLNLNGNSPATNPITTLGHTSTTFNLSYVGSAPGFSQNETGVQYVAYLFADDPSTDGLIRCGQYTGTGSFQEVNLGWETQFIIVKNVSAVANWAFTGDCFGYTPNGTNNYAAQTGNMSSASGGVTPNPDGFAIFGSSAVFNANTDKYIYIAVRKQLQEALNPSEVFNTMAYGGSGAVRYFPVSNNRIVDWNWNFLMPGDGVTPYSFYMFDARDGAGSFSYNPVLYGRRPDQQGAALSIPYGQYEGRQYTPNQDFVNGSGDQIYRNNLTRAKFIFDRVRYTGNGSTKVVKHNLGAVPEMAIVKNMSSGSYLVYHKDLGANQYMKWDSQLPPVASTGFWPSFTDTTFTATNIHNTVINNYHAYLFASKAGFSKVGSYVGNGSTQTIDCGFNGGPRLVLIKATSTNADNNRWIVCTQAGKIVEGPDYFFSFDEFGYFSNKRVLEPTATGFSVTQSGAPDYISYANKSGVTYIYLAIA